MVLCPGWAGHAAIQSFLAEFKLVKNGREGGKGGEDIALQRKTTQLTSCLPPHFSLHQGWWLTDGWKSPRLCLFLWVCFCRQLNSSSVCLYCVLFQIFCFEQRLICISAPWSATDGKQTWDSLDCKLGLEDKKCEDTDTFCSFYSNKVSLDAKT